jgi:hypothetical protein
MTAARPEGRATADASKDTRPNNDAPRGSTAPADPLLRLLYHVLVVQHHGRRREAG